MTDKQQEHLNLRKCHCGASVMRWRLPIDRDGCRWAIHCPTCGIVFKNPSRKEIVIRWNKGEYMEKEIKILKCPCCGQTLSNHGGFDLPPVWQCDNTDCHETQHLYGSYEMWQALIDGKKAQDALKACRKHISDIIAEWNRHAQDHKPSPRQMLIFACRARDEIKSITKDTNNDLGTVA